MAFAIHQDYPNMPLEKICWVSKSHKAPPVGHLDPSPHPLWLWNLTFWTSPIFFFTLFLGVGRTVKWEGNWSTIDHNQIGLVHQKGQENVCDQGKRNHSWFLLITKVTRSGFYHYLKGVFAEDILVSCLHFPGFQNSSNDNIHLSDCLGNIYYFLTHIFLENQNLHLSTCYFWLRRDPQVFGKLLCHYPRMLELRCLRIWQI